MVVGLGTNNFGMGMAANDVDLIVGAALEEGVNFFDTSDPYGESEERLGRALGNHRDEVILTTKFGSPVAGQEGTQRQSRTMYPSPRRRLRRLGTDRIDLYQIHRPDETTPIGDTLTALGEAVKAGKVREIGCSNFSASQLREAHASAGDGAHFVSVQNHYNLLHRADDAEVLPLCKELGLAYLPYFPLESGLLTGKYRKGDEPADGTRLQRWGAGYAARVLSEENLDKVEL